MHTTCTSDISKPFQSTNFEVSYQVINTKSEINSMKEGMKKGHQQDKGGSRINLLSHGLCTIISGHER